MDDFLEISSTKRKQPSSFEPRKNEENIMKTFQAIQTTESVSLSKFTVKAGQKLEILDLSGECLVCERLHEMGLRKGTFLSVLGRAPFGGPILLRYKTSFLALRNDEAECVMVVEVK